MENEKSIITKIVGVSILIIMLLLILVKKGVCEEKDYVNMSKLDILKELYTTKNENIALKNELNDLTDLLVQEKEKNKQVIERYIECKNSINTFIKPIVKPKDWNDYVHLYLKLNYLTDIKEHGFMINTGIMAGGFYNTWFNFDFSYNRLDNNDLRMNTGVMLWY